MIAAMDEKRPAFSVKALGSPRSGAALRLPDRGFPGLDDRLVVPEVTRDEMIGGRRVVASPADRPHARQHGKLSVLNFHVAPGYSFAVDQLTRHDEESDFASDACIYKEGIDPATGTRYLEEIAFEVVSTQSARNATEKAVRMHRRGVRRIFAVWLKNLRVCEWSPESQDWRPLAEDAQIEDPCLALPLAVKALLDAAMADNAVVKALKAKDNPEIRELEAAAKAEGRAEGLQKGLQTLWPVVLAILEQQYGSLTAEARSKMEAISSVEELTGLVRRALAGASLAELGLT